MADFLQHIQIDAGQIVVLFLVPREVGQTFPGAFQPIGLVGFVIGGGLELGVQMGFEIILDLGGLGLGHGALGNQLVAQNLARRRMLGDGRVHDRLGEHGLVALVMTMAAIAEHVDDHIAFEFLAEMNRQIGNPADRHRIIAVDVENRRLHALGDIGGIGRRA